MSLGESNLEYGDASNYRRNVLRFLNASGSLTAQSSFDSSSLQYTPKSHLISKFQSLHDPKAEVDILFVGFVGGLGGASVLMLEMATRMIARGLRVKIVVPAYDTTISFAERCVERGIPVERLSWLIEGNSNLSSFINAIRFIRKYRAPVIHYHMSGNTMRRFFIMALEFLRMPPAFASLHGPFDEPGPDELQARHWGWAAPRIFKKVICVSERARQRQIRYGIPPEKLELIYNGVDIARFSSGVSSIARGTLGLADNVPLIVFTARIAPQKRPLDAVQAFQKLATQFPDAHMVFVGDGPLAKETKAKAEQTGLIKRIHFVGHQSNIADWLAAATVWFLPTETEGFSVGVIEAMAAGAPVVSTMCPGNDEVLIDGENALLASVGDVDAMAASLGRLLSDEGLRKRLISAGRQAAQHYSLERVVDEHLVCYTGGRIDNETLGSRKPSPTTA